MKGNEDEGKRGGRVGGRKENKQEEGEERKLRDRIPKTSKKKLRRYFGGDEVNFGLWDIDDVLRIDNPRHCTRRSSWARRYSPRSRSSGSRSRNSRTRVRRGNVTTGR